ncbi:MAG: WYL domain-containing protein [Lachnospiraceae bacterium]|nr:WYL domain-containing protein [Lachnospiraceae bacterium]
MPRSDKQKLKLMYLIKLFEERTDVSHGLSMTDIIEALSEEGITAERKSIYADISALNEFGFDIVKDNEGKACVYKLVERDFEIAELKLLVDAVQSSKFITESKSNKLIKKIEGLASNNEAKSLHRQVYVANRIKTTNESVYYNVDDIQKAISENHKVSFQYFQWNPNKEKELRHNGMRYEISPWALTWDDENYYMVGYDSKERKIKHYRVDKMLKIEIMADSKREGKALFKDMDMAVYSKKIFGMFGGVEETVVLECKNGISGVIIDRFGTEVDIIKRATDSFTVRVNVQISPQFLGWVFSLGENIKIISPDRVIERMRDEIARIQGIYN